MRLLPLILLISCTSSSELSDSSFYSRFLGISLPSDLHVLYTNTVSHDIQDYSAFTVFRLYQSDINKIISEVQNRLCDSVMKAGQESCWIKYGSYYTFYQSTEEARRTGFAIKATITNDDGIDTLLIAIAKL